MRRGPPVAATASHVQSALTRPPASPGCGMRASYEVLVLGAGPAGCAVAVELASLGLAVALITVVAGQAASSSGDNLPVSAREFLPTGFDWQCLDRDHQPAYQLVSWWSSREPVWRDSIQNPLGHGWHLNRALFDASLLALAREQGVAVITCQQAVIHSTESPWQVEALPAAPGGHPTHVAARYLVDCTGRHRLVSRRLAVPSLRYDALFSLTALYTGPAGSPPTETVVEATPHGWWYSALLPDNQRAVSFFTNAKDKSLRQWASPAAFAALVGTTRLVAPVLAGAALASPVRGRLANSSCTQTIVGDHWLSVGDAAAAFDPLSSQGIGTALKMGRMAAQAIQVFLHTGLPHQLRAYEEAYQQLFAHYLGERPRYYRQVTAWADHPFWVENQR